MMDSFGVYGMAADYAVIFLFTGGALIGFLYFWGRGRLDMDEEPKFEMMKEDIHE